MPKKRKSKGLSMAKIIEMEAMAMRHRGKASSQKAKHKKLRDYCVHCDAFHTKGQHRSHGKGSFKRTHPGYPY